MLIGPGLRYTDDGQLSHNRTVAIWSNRKE